MPALGFYVQRALFYARMPQGYFRLRWAPLEPDPPSLVRRFVENRETHFLELMKRAVFASPSHPYRTLFQWAGCTYGDLEKSMRSDGLEATLEAVRQAGVYLTHDEFKGKTPVRRGARELVVAPADLVNPLVTGVISNVSSGSRSSGTVSSQSLEYLVHREAQEQIFLEDLGMSQQKHVRLSSILPNTGSVRRGLLLPRRGYMVDKWFTLAGPFRESGHYQLMTGLLMLQARLLGVKATFPTYLPHNDFSPAARWLARRRAQGFACTLSGGVSMTVRVAAAAAELGLDISGTVVRTSGEALTDAKRAVIEAAGCKPYPSYSIIEVGKIGNACSQMNTGNCVHVCRDSVAVISRRRRAPLTDVEIDSLMFTNLLPFAPSIMVNVEMDDSGKLETARCGCPLNALGLTQQISSIYSYGKLTGQGVTLIGGDVLDILERRLPQRFGGVPTDYQLVECEGAHQTEVELRVHPQVGAASEWQVKNFFLEELNKIHGGLPTRRNWVETNGVRVVFGEPFRTGTRGKVHSLHLLGTATQQQGK